MKYTHKRAIILSTISIIVIMIFAGLTYLRIHNIYHQAMFTSDSIQLRKAEKFAEDTLKIKDTSQGCTVFVGDSITELYDLDKYYPNKGYINRGISSNESGYVLKRLQSNVLDLKPARIVLLVGANDLGHKIPKSELINNINTILITIREQLPDCQVIVQSVLPTKQLKYWASIHNSGVRPNDKINEINIDIERVTKQNNYMYLNTHRYFAGPDGKMIADFSIDGLHLNHNGYLILTDKINEAFDNYFTN